MTTTPEQERRHFERIPFHALAHIKSEQGDLYLNCEVLDISLHGVLIQKPGQWHMQQQQPCQVDLVLDQGQLVIEMQATVKHIDSDQVGLVCEQIDLDSMTHLKRLIALNLADEQQLYRELSALSKL